MNGLCPGGLSFLMLRHDLADKLCLERQTPSREHVAGEDIEPVFHLAQPGGVGTAWNEDVISRCRPASPMIFCCLWTADCRQSRAGACRDTAGEEFLKLEEFLVVRARDAAPSTLPACAASAARRHVVPWRLSVAVSRVGVHGRLGSWGVGPVRGLNLGLMSTVWDNGTFSGGFRYRRGWPPPASPRNHWSGLLPHQ